ncbi:ribosome maturation factor RimM [Lachnoclostridium sp. Marseille-P6806]|uniref:ribosome maturation factor RimM n=1 Tax=Lachnoclostridium sp. Marseille-P6806 TaxID=2364793 RepID=UPI001031F4A9|nr:ribosome maturation factor RimM [Lachnoclostridium sp. Marseille-P6806]
MTERFRVGIIAGMHGLKGEVRVFPTTDDPQRFRKLKTVYLVGRKQEQILTIRSVKFVGQFVVLGFEEFDRIEDVERLRSFDLEIDRKDAVPLAEGEHFIPDLIGLSVIGEADEAIGTLTDVLETGANKVYVVQRPEGKELLLPVIPDCVREVCPEKGYIRVFLMPGLTDL